MGRSFPEEKFILKHCLGLSEDKVTVAVMWEKSYNYTTQILVHPYYKVVSGTLVEKDLWKNDEKTSFVARIPIGYELRVYGY